eukprot:evm.model.scf_1229.1 EVM.evm.TU.scf_1229.1   scf_1229:2683-5962(-)
MASATAGSTSSATSSGGDDSSVQASAVAVSKGGSSFAASSASTEALRQAEDTFAEAVLRVIPQMSGNKSCEDVIEIVSLEVEAIGLAFASAYADAFGQVELEGEGSACADASATAASTAESFSAIVAGVLFDALGEHQDDVEGVEALTVIISEAAASAFADAYASVCTTGGYGQAQQLSFAQAVAAPISRAFILAISGSDCLDAYDASLAESATAGEALVDGAQSTATESTSSIEGQGSATSAGAAEAAAGSAADSDAAKSESTALSVSDSANATSQATAAAESAAGESQASAVATTEVIEEVQRAVDTAFEEAAAKHDGQPCEEVLESVRASAEAHATAVASAYAVAFGEAFVEGDGSACAQASSQAIAQADAFARAVAGALLHRYNGSGQERLESIAADATAQAFADAYASVCTAGGYGAAEQASFAEAVAEALAAAFVFASGGEGCLDAYVEASGNASVFAESTSSTVANGLTDAEGAGLATANTAGAAEGEGASADSAATSVSDSPDGNADALSSATSTEGSASAAAVAVAEVIVRAASGVVAALEDVALTGLDCEAAVDQVHQTVGEASRAFVSAYVSTVAEAAVEGDGSACAEAAGSAEAASKAFATVLVDVIVDKAGADTPHARDIQSIVAAGAAKAFADAFSMACAEEGLAAAQQDSFAEALTHPIVQAVALAAGGEQCREVAEAKYDSVTATTQSDAVVEGTGSADNGGNAAAETAAVEDQDEINALLIASVDQTCSKEFRMCCIGRNAAQDECKCSLSAN